MGRFLARKTPTDLKPKNSKNMELIKNLEEKKKSWTLWARGCPTKTLWELCFLCVLLFLFFFFVFFFCVCDFCFSKVFEVFHRFRRNLAAASKPIRTMNIQKRRSIRVQYLMNYKAICVAKLHLWWPAVLLFFRHWRSIFSALPLTQKHRVRHHAL